MAPTPLLTIDALGRKCPIPIIMLAERIHEVPIGEIIAVLADDPAAENDVPAWCLMKSHDHVLHPVAGPRRLVDPDPPRLLSLARGATPEPPACAPRPRGGTSPTHRPLAGHKARLAGPVTIASP